MFYKNTRVKELLSVLIMSVSCCNICNISCCCCCCCCCVCLNSASLSWSSLSRSACAAFNCCDLIWWLSCKNCIVSAPHLRGGWAPPVLFLLLVSATVSIAICLMLLTSSIRSFVLAQLVQLVILSIYARGLFFYLLLIFKFFHDSFEPISTGSFCNLESPLLVAIGIAGNSSPCCNSVTLLFGIWFYTCDLLEQAQFMLLFPDKQP